MKLRSARFVLATIGALALGCGSSALAGLASEGKLDELRAGIQSKRATLKNQEVAQISRATLASALTKAKGLEGESLVSALDECATELTLELGRRAEIQDDVGFAAALLLLERGKYSAGKARDFESSREVGGRALWARTLTEASSGEARRKALLDPEARIRRAALGASAVAHDPKDTEVLLEVARLDPDEFCRSRAYQILGSLGGEEVSRRLYDRYVAAPDAEKHAIIEAWASEKLVHAQGAEFLVKTMNLGPEAGYLRLEAASRLARTDSELASAAEALLVRTLHEGTRGERIFAIVHVSMTQPTEEALALLLSDADKTVAIVAAARLLDSSRLRDKATQYLRASEGEDSEDGRRARAALSASHAKPADPPLLKGLASADPVTRLSTGRAFLRLGRYSESAVLLGDKDEYVRVTHACSLLAHLNR